MWSSISFMFCDKERWVAEGAGTCESGQMSAVEEIKQACATRLTVAERAEVAAWLRDFDDEWDRQIEADAMAGKLDKLFAQADAEFLAGRCKAL